MMGVDDAMTYLRMTPQGGSEVSVPGRLQTGIDSNMCFMWPEPQEARKQYSQESSVEESP